MPPRPYTPPPVATVPNKMDKWTLATNIIGLVLIPTVGVAVVWAIGWMIDAKFTMQRNDIDRAVSENYVSKPTFNAVIESIHREADATRGKVDTATQDIANIRGEMGNTVHTK